MDDKPVPSTYTQAYVQHRSSPLPGTDASRTTAKEKMATLNTIFSQIFDKDKMERIAITISMSIATQIVLAPGAIRLSAYI